MAVLHIQEYGRIHCGDKFDPLSKTVTKAQRHRLEKFSEEYKRQHKVAVLQYGPHQTLVAQNFVGVINLGRDQVEVLPKIDGLAGNETQVRQNLAEMIACTLDLTLRDGDASKMNLPSDSILEILIRLFCKHLWLEVHKGMLRSYEHRSDTLTVLRGRLSVERQIRENSLRPDLLACDFDEFTENNQLNQTLKAALRVLSRVTRSSSNQRSVSELLFCFNEVDDVMPGSLRREQNTTNRISARYEKLLSLAHLFLRNEAPDVISGAGDGFALLFDMNELFEKYIGRLVQKLFTTPECLVRLQKPTRHLARRMDGVSAFELRPDIVGCQSDRISWIVDTKWKRLDASRHREGVSSGDMYQMHAYARRYETQHVFLLYPHHDTLGPWVGRRAAYQLEPVFPDAPLQQVSVGTVDLRDLSTVASQLRAILPVVGI